MTLAEALSAERARQGLSVYELAKRSQLRAIGIHKILDGSTPNPGLLTTVRILSALGRDLAWLVKQLGEPK
ncbi:MAG TPA: helix-turn-helix domain-containing protein [Gemmata sp.]|nr:helix-turn-helix domain-containing protein [Gemmata sp.]